MKSQIFFSIIFLIVIIKVDHCRTIDVYNAVTRYPNDLHWWAGAEVSFFENVTAFVKDFDSSKDLHGDFSLNVKSYRKDYEDSFNDLVGFNGSEYEKVVAITANPIACYRMMRRIVLMLPDLIPLMKQHNASLVEAFPDWWLRLDDIQDSIMGLLRIQHVHNLDASSLSKGIIVDRKTGASLNAVHCYEIGLFAHQQNFHTLAIEWLTLGEKLGDGTVDKPLVKTALINTVNRHDQLFDNRWRSDPYYYERKIGPNIQSTKILRKMRDILVQNNKGKKETEHNDVNFWELCSHGSFQSEQVKSKLFCWHETKIHPVWLLKPLKMEFLSINPDVVQIYDIIGDKRIEKIKEMAEPEMLVSTVVDNDKGTPGATKRSWVRTSVGTWIEEKTDPLVAGIPLQIEQMTGLHVAKSSSSESLQVGSYTFGGHYEVHIDSLKTATQYGEKGDRVATFLFYLNDVQLGGYTAFAQAGTVAKPVKGSAIFWYNIHTDGTSDNWTYHGACPVIVGQKWVANKWIRIYDQMLSHPCSIDSPTERHRIAVNGKIIPIS